MDHSETFEGQGGARARRTPLDALLSVFTQVQAGEGLTAVLLMLNVFLLLGAYYILKTLREPLILAGGGAEVKSYAAAGQALLLLVLVPAYAAVASRVGRLRLLVFVTAFFVLNLVGFWAAGVANAPWLGVAFFIWVGVFSLMVVAQFWAFANDLYTPEQGKRLFAIVAFGSSLGAIAGAALAKPMIAAMGVHTPMLVAAGVLALSIVLFAIVHTRERVARAAGGRPVSEDAPIGTRGAFRLVFTRRYLLLLALMVLVYNFVNTNGEYILGKTLTGLAQARVAAGATGGVAPQDFEEKFIGVFYAGYFTWVNVLSAAIQLLLVGRILHRFGVRVALFVMPIISLGGYALLAAAPLLGLVRGVKILENSVDYSLQNTTRQALFLPTSREAKYKAKQAIDSFFQRLGDVASAILVFAGTHAALKPAGFAVANVVLVCVWLVLAFVIGRRYRRLEEGVDPAESAA